MSAESTLCIEKLKRLWRSFDEGTVAPRIRERFDNALNSCDYLLKWNVPEVLKNSESAKESCPEQGMANVKDNLLESARELGGDLYGEIAIESVEKTWNKLCLQVGRTFDFRTLSNAYATKPYELEDVTGFPTQIGLDSWLFSYNFPWHIALWMQRIHNGEKFNDADWSYFKERDDQEAVRPNGVTRHRFQVKYLWMLANPKVVPILSLWSFNRLLPVFVELDNDFRERFGYGKSVEGKSVWQQDGKDFAEKWPQISKILLEKLLEKEQFPDGEDGVNLRKKFALFLFAVSLTDQSAIDLDGMLETGNHAVILYGPPGTGKTYTAQKAVERLLHVESPQDAISATIDLPENKDFDVPKETLFATISNQHGWMSLVQFHPNYTYQDFVGGIFPETKDDKIVYVKRRGLFQKICEIAKSGIEYGAGGAEVIKKKFYLIIDEINRADLSGVFGELMYALEYRNKPVAVPLFPPFSVPPNVYIIGTMNNTDKSLIGFDLALRRRFGFMKIMPDMNVLKCSLPLVIKDDNGEYADISLAYAQRAEELNAALCKSVEENGLGLSEDKQIGHAYFLKVKDFCEVVPDASNEGHEIQSPWILTPFALEQVWDYHIEPLLEEYLGLEFQEREEAVKKLRAQFSSELKSSQA